MTNTNSFRRPLRIVLPFANDPQQLAPFLESLGRCEQELKDLRCQLITATDLRTEEPLALHRVHIEKNERIGPIEAANVGLKQAVADRSDVVLFSSTSIVDSGALREMQRVAYLDSMIGFVSPRSNDAVIGSFPPREEFRHAPSFRAHAIFTELSRYLPALQYVPFSNANCMFIKFEILREFGCLKEDHEILQSAIDDLVMRANRCGYRAALANHAFVYHGTNTPYPTVHSTDNEGSLFSPLYPEYKEQRAEYFRSPHHQAEALLTGLLKDERGRYDVVFDFSSFGAHHNGTFELAKQMLKHASASWKDFFNLYVLIHDDAVRFHGLDQISGISLVPLETNQVFAIAIRIGQPFQYESIIRMSTLAVINAYCMLDPIAWDCLYLHNDEVEETWRAVFSFADAIAYISDFAANQFHLRFKLRAGMRELVSYPSLEMSDYLQGSHVPGPGEHLLVVGNAFAHKNVAPTVEILSREFPDQEIIAVGLEQSSKPNVTAYRSGHIREDLLQSLYSKAQAVVFPSFYEGFGFPILHGLACKKPVLARSTPVNQELYEKLGRPENLALYGSTKDLILLLKKGFPRWKDSRSFHGRKHDWVDCSKEIGEFLRGLIDDVHCSDQLIARLNYMNQLQRIADAKRQANNLAESLEKRNAQLHELEKEVSHMQMNLRDRQMRLDNILSSVSWAITAPMRSLGNFWIRITGDKSRDRSA